MTHVPSGLVVYCADSRSQHENKLSARTELERRLAVRADRRQAQATNEKRVAQVKAVRAAKTFTWNNQCGTVVDHESGRTWRMKDFVRGKIK